MPVKPKITSPLSFVVRENGLKAGATALGGSAGGVAAGGATGVGAVGAGGAGGGVVWVNSVVVVVGVVVAGVVVAIFLALGLSRFFFFLLRAMSWFCWDKSSVVVLELAAGELGVAAWAPVISSIMAKMLPVVVANQLNFRFMVRK